MPTKYPPVPYSICPASVRMLVARAVAFRVGGGVKVETELVPVVALLAYSPDGLQEPDVNPLVCDDDWGVVPVRIAMGCGNVAYRTVAAPWPPEEDATRLARTLDGLADDARQALADSEAREARRTAAKAAPAG